MVARNKTQKKNQTFYIFCEYLSLVTKLFNKRQVNKQRINANKNKNEERMKECKKTDEEKKNRNCLLNVHTSSFQGRMIEKEEMYTRDQIIVYKMHKK